MGEKMKFEILSVGKKRAKADVLVAGCFLNENAGKKLETLEPAFAKLAAAIAAKKRFEGKLHQSFSSFDPGYCEATDVILCGLGEKKGYKDGCLRKVAAQIARQAKARKAATVRILTDSFCGAGINEAQAAAITAEAFVLAGYRFDQYKTKKNEDGESSGDVQAVEFLTSKKQNETLLKEKIRRAHSIAEGVLFARNLINEPGNVMNAVKIAETASALARDKKISCTVLDEKKLEELKMGGILAVNRGSVTPPRLVILEYGTRFKSRGTICLVGKGVTFDTGGISLKPSKDMEKMKYDMSGAAAVIAAMGVIADLKLPLHVIGLAPLVENIVAVDPQRPGDIIRMSNGKTVEVINTDAEGRLILGDALAYTERYKPKAIIDLATLTGLCALTFGDKAIGLLGNNQKLIERVIKAGETTGERCWQLPLWEDYAEQIKGHHSDLLNVGGPNGGTITAAMFLKQFVPDGVPWAHLDIAGVAWTEKEKSATGAGVRLLAELLSSWR
jgi:leucyl aminopeptidase